MLLDWFEKIAISSNEHFAQALRNLYTYYPHLSIQQACDCVVPGIAYCRVNRSFAGIISRWLSLAVTLKQHFLFNRDMASAEVRLLRQPVLTTSLNPSKSVYFILSELANRAFGLILPLRLEPSLLYLEDPTKLPLIVFYIDDFFGNLQTLLYYTTS